jgi:RNA polymerase sigma-70 factor (ECF subfamily)
LIQQILQGDNEAFGQLFRKYNQQIYSICFSILNNSHDAEEATSETFIHAYLKLDQLERTDRFSAWLQKIARNCCIDLLRRKQEDTIPLALATEQTSSQTSPDRSLLKQELINAIMRAIKSLPQKDREVIQAYIDGLSHSEVSEQFDISISAAMTRLHRIRKKIIASVRDFLEGVFSNVNSNRTVNLRNVFWFFLFDEKLFIHNQ